MEMELKLISESAPPEQTEELKTPLNFEDSQTNLTSLQHTGSTANANGGLGIDASANGGLSANGPSVTSVKIRAPGRTSSSASVGIGGRRRWVNDQWQRVKFVALCIAIVAVWVLLSLPIIFYQVSPGSNEDQPQVNSTRTCMAGNQRCDAVAQGSGVCSSSIDNLYSGSICRSYLQEFQSCLSGREGSGDVYIAPKEENQGSVESQVEFITASLPSSVNPSVQCEEAIKPFLCLYLFRLCDGDGGLYEPSCGQCVSIRDDICAREWIKANELLPGLLPVCEEFPDSMGSNAGSGFMTDNDTSSGDLEPSSDGGSGSMQTQPARNCSTIQCSDGFYCTLDASLNISICRPRCDTWEQDPHTIVVATDIIVILSGVINLVAGAAVLIISGIRWKRMFTFPSVFAIYLTITLVVFALFVLVSYTDKPGLFCNSLDLEESIENPTTYCILTGIVLYYTLLQEAMWWFIHVAILFWQVKFPFHARTFLTNARRKTFLHITGVVIALVLPTMPVIVNATIGGFGLTRFPPILCTGVNANATFYSLIVPIIVLMQIGITLLLITMWIIHRQQGLFRTRQSKSPFKLGTAEKKLLIVFCYYIVLGVIALTTFTLVTRNAERHAEEFFDHFRCEASGTGDCPTSELEAFTYPWLNTITYTLLGLFPAINLTFAVNVTELKQFCGCTTRYRLASTSTASRATATSTISKYSIKS